MVEQSLSMQSAKKEMEVLWEQLLIGGTSNNSILTVLELPKLTETKLTRIRNMKIFPQTYLVRKELRTSLLITLISRRLPSDPHLTGRYREVTQKWITKNPR